MRYLSLLTKREKGLMQKASKRRLVATTLFATTLILCAAGESRGIENRLSGWDQYNVPFDYWSTSNPVSLNYPNIVDMPLSGYADAATQTLRSYAQTDSFVNDPNLYQSGDMTIARIAAEYSNILTIGAGTSGLSPGDPITLSLALSLDGDISTGTIPMCINCVLTLDPAASKYQLATVDVWASYKINDQLLVWGGEGWYSPPIVNFGYGSNEYFSAVNISYVQVNYNQQWRNTYDPENDGRMVMENEMGWDISTNAGAYDSDYYNNYTECAFHNCGGSVVGVFPFLYNNSVYDTGLINVDFNTYVGAVLDITGAINLLPQAYGLNIPTSAAANYLNTFDAEVSSPYVNGIELIYGSQDANVAPEPVSMLLVGIGLAGLPLVRRFRGVRKGSA